MLHNEARELLVEAYEKTGNAKEVAECFKVDKSTVYRLSRQKKATGSVKLRMDLDYSQKSGQLKEKYTYRGQILIKQFRNSLI